MMRFDRFTEKAQEAAMRAYEILQQYKHTQVDTEHVFLALLQQNGGAVPQIMQTLQAPVPEMVEKLTNVLESAPRASSNPYGGAATAQVFITPRLKRIMDIAYEEAMKMKDEYISTEHMLLAVASERNTPSANVLREATITKERIAKRSSRSARGSASPSRTPRVNIACWRNMGAT
jgi:ATP-dependent Clp protease ATP-binding subunit ClpC